MKNAVFWYVTPCDSYKEPTEGTYHLYHQGGKNQQARSVSNYDTTILRNVLYLLITANVVPS
jgi:hypothetical protein